MWRGQPNHYGWQTCNPPPTNFQIMLLSKEPIILSTYQPSHMTVDIEQKDMKDTFILSICFLFVKCKDAGKSTVRVYLMLDCHPYIRLWTISTSPPLALTHLLMLTFTFLKSISSPCVAGRCCSLLTVSKECNGHLLLECPTVTRPVRQRTPG